MGWAASAWGLGGLRLEFSHVLSGQVVKADTNYLLLGLVVEALTSSPLPAAFRERVFTPAGMSRQGTYCEFLEDPGRTLWQHLTRLHCSKMNKVEKS